MLKRIEKHFPTFHVDNNAQLLAPPIGTQAKIKV